MPDVKLTSFVEAESKLDGSEAVYIAQNGKTRKTFLSKVKTFILEDILKVVGDVDVENDGDIATQLNALAKNFSNTDITIYVSKSGNDTTGDGTEGKPYLTIQKALNSIPHIAKGNKAIVMVDDGTYNENLNIKGVIGAVTLRSKNLTIGACKILSFSAINVSNVSVGYIEAISDGTTFYFEGCGEVTVTNCKSVTQSSYDGVSFKYSFGFVINTEISNKGNAMINKTSMLFSNNNTGSGNTIGLNVTEGGTTGKYGTQPSATTAEVTTGGGVIR